MNLKDKNYNELIQKIKYHNLNDVFDKNLLLALKKLKKISYLDYIKDINFINKNYIFIHKLLEYVNKNNIFSIEPFLFNWRYTILYKIFFSNYLYSLFYIKNNIFLIDNKNSIKKSIFKSDISFLLRKKKDSEILFLDFWFTKTHYNWAFIDNCGDYEGGFYLSIIYWSNNDNLINNLNYNNYSYNLWFYLWKQNILISQIHRKARFYIPTKVSILKIFMIFLSNFKKSIIWISDELAFSRFEKWYKYWTYNKIYEKYFFDKNNWLYVNKNLEKHLFERNIKVENIEIYNIIRNITKLLIK